jgi:hypothetical protein
MSDLERTKAQKEALESAAKEGSSTARARLWAGMNRYLAAEARREHDAAEDERRGGPESPSDQST